MSAARLMTLMLSLAVMVGCSSWSDGQKGAGAGALTGALVGAGIGYAMEGSTDGTVAGALIGGAVGAGIGYATAEALKDRDETISTNQTIQETLGVPGVVEALAIELVRVSPLRVQPGQPMTINVIHGYVGTGGPRETAIRVRVYDSGNSLVIDETQTLMFEDGTHSTDIPMAVPRNILLGNCAVDVELSTAGARDNRGTVFVVF